MGFTEDLMDGTVIHPQNAGDFGGLPPPQPRFHDIAFAQFLRRGPNLAGLVVQQTKEQFICDLLRRHLQGRQVPGDILGLDVFSGVSHQLLHDAL